MVISVTERSVQRSPPIHGDYCIRLKIPASACEDAWEMCQTALYYGGVELRGCCFAFRSEERRMAALESLRLRFGPEYFESVDTSAIDSGTRLLFFARDSDRAESYCRFFAQRGFLVSQAGNWAEAMEILHNWHPDVAIVKDDMLWGGGDGMHEGDQAYAELATTPVVLIGKRRGGEGSTSRSAFSVIARFREPVPLDCLLNTIRSVVSARQPGL